ncbi:alcohol dehydrogenase catalytic domain-containing protein [Microbacterium sp. NPDC058342]|uniref:alcohol dehydrogenase catalytic domain-containing protein n=1 Tax=Microbacterium sp. NPDC058342 TaxID=3346454 RepID=UPI003653D3DE
MKVTLETAPALSRRPSAGHDPGRRDDVVLRPAAIAMAFVGAGLAQEEIAVPGVALAADDVLVSIELSTICGSDLVTVQGLRPAEVPLVLGHESVGRIIALGSAGADAADGTPLRVGDRVVWSVAVSCGDCDRCRAGLTQKCRHLGEYGNERITSHRELAGGFASHAHLRRGTAIVRAPEHLPAAVLAPASCATATAWAAVEAGARGGDLHGARVRVHGAGLLGLSAAAIAHSRGAVVDVIDPDPARRALAVRFGAEANAPAEPDIVIEASGHAVKQAIDGVTVGGTVVLTETAPAAEPVPLETESLVRRLVTVIGVHGCTGHDLAAAVSFLAGPGRAHPFAEVVSPVHPLSALDRALAAASGPDAHLRVAVAMR